MSGRATARRATPLAFALAALCLFGYVQPWIVAPAGSLTLNAYDLAEWSSLVPAQRATSPPLLAPLLLRLPLTILCALLGAIAQGRGAKSLSAFAIVILALAQLPPVEFALDINNLNYRQQFSLAALSLIAGFSLMLRSGRRFTALVSLALSAAGVATSILGYAGAEALYQRFHLDPSPGAGLWIMILAWVAIGATALGSLRLARALDAA